MYCTSNVNVLQIGIHVQTKKKHIKCIFYKVGGP